MKGAYKLGKAIVDRIAGLDGQLAKEDKGYAKTPANRMKMRSALLEGVRDAGFIYLWLLLVEMLPAEPLEEPKEE